LANSGRIRTQTLAKLLEQEGLDPSDAQRLFSDSLPPPLPSLSTPSKNE